jgi:hypothetical protein
MNEASEKLKSINIVLKKDLERLLNAGDVSLLSGAAGLVMYLTKFSEVYEDESLEDLINTSLTRIIDHTELKGLKTSAYSNGLCGVSWLLNFLIEREYVELDSDDLIVGWDNYLSKAFTNLLLEDNWNLLHGGLGLAFYFLGKNNIVEVEKMITYLDNKAIESDNRSLWLRFAEDQSQFIFDLGFANGNASLLCFLVQSFKQGIMIETCHKLIDRLTQAYIYYAQDYNLFQCYWKDFVTAQEFEDMQTNPPQPGLAWGYGDLMILNNLFDAAKVTANAKNEQVFLELLKITAAKMSLIGSSISDPNIYEGSSGVAMIYSHLYKTTSNPIFYQAYQFWFKTTIDFLNQDDKGANEGLPNQKTGLLDGLAGIGLMLINDAIATENSCRNLFEEKQIFFIF